MDRSAHRAVLTLLARTGADPAAANAPALRAALLLVLLAEALAAADARGVPSRSLRPRAAPPPRRPVRAARGALSGRRPRG